VTALLLALLSLLAGPVPASAFLPSLFFTILVMGKLGGDSGAFLRTAVLAEFGKLFLTGLLCAAAFIWVKPLAAGFFFLGMIGVIVGLNTPPG
jgi:hypothetical protein